MQLYSTDTNSVFKQKEARFQMTHVTLELSVSKTISEPMVRSTQTVLPSYVKISTISKRTEMGFHLILVT